MRKIKFRTWDGKKIEYNPLVPRHDFDVHLNHMTEWNSDIIFMLYTGLKDAKGIDIYEGDIVRGIIQTTDPKMMFSTEKEMKKSLKSYKHDDGKESVWWEYTCTGVIKWWESSAKFAMEELKELGAIWDLFNGGGTLMFLTPDCEIIGNIHENSKIIKRK